MQKKMRDGDMIANGIISYIDARYGDPDLSLALLADQFDISQPYLSSLFKQTHGINLSTYIENIRIEKAKDFLKTTDLTINKISEMVGYGSTNSFCRAFKRVTGISTCGRIFLRNEHGRKSDNRKPGKNKNLGRKK